MVKLSDLRDYCNSLMALVGADRLVMAVQEEHLKKKLRDDPGVVLAAVYPSVVGVGRADNTGDNNTVLLFVLEFAGKSSMTEDKEMECYERLQVMAGVIRDKIILDADDGNELMMFLDRESIEIEPEWNIAGNFIGWSVAFSFEN